MLPELQAYALLFTVAARVLLQYGISFYAGTCSLAPCSANASCNLPRAPTSGPALPPLLCSDPIFTCGSSGEVHLKPQLYAALAKASSCSAGSRQDLCVVGSNLVEQSVFVSVKSGTCQQVKCLLYEALISV